MPFFVEDQSGNHIYVINDVTSFEIKKSITAPPEQKEAYTAYANLPNGAVMLGQYAAKKEARKELDYLVDSILKGERRFSFCAQRMQNWRGL